MRPLILLSNDDGYSAPNLLALRAALLTFADVVVCAPELNQSATSHSLSLHRSLRLRRVEPDVFSLDGTPADCVYVALNSGVRILPRRPDIAVSGLNHGLNLGIDVFYSGTVAAAREAAFRGIPALAASADHDADRNAAAELTAKITRAIWHQHPTPQRRAPLFNLNIPPGNRWKVEATTLGARLYDDGVVYRQDPRGREYLWIGGSEPRHEPKPGSDTDAHDAGHASLTPLSLDLFEREHAAAANAVAGAASDESAS
ncbi:MAG: 5'/3'-nucleotidase SurE [Polyangiaceae bacterium]|nr:5'/3'-nucleotidase SurE [Polyangiaceae bacterium]